MWAGGRTKARRRRAPYQDIRIDQTAHPQTKAASVCQGSISLPRQHQSAGVLNPTRSRSGSSSSSSSSSNSSSSSGSSSRGASLKAPFSPAPHRLHPIGCARGASLKAPFSPSDLFSQSVSQFSQFSQSVRRWCQLPRFAWETQTNTQTYKTK